MSMTKELAVAKKELDLAEVNETNILDMLDQNALQENVSTSIPVMKFKTFP